MRTYFTKTVFIHDKKEEMAVTGTDTGMIVVWKRSLIIEGIGEQNEKRLYKIVTLNNNTSIPNSVEGGSKINQINILTTHNEYLVCGNNDGTIRFYDFHFKLVAWFEDLYFKQIKSISFSKTEPRYAIDPKDAYDPEPEEKSFKHEILRCADFLVQDECAQICMLQSQLFEQINPSKKKGYTIMSGIQSSISAIAVHPRQTILAIAGSEGFVLLWDFMKKNDPIHNFEYFRKVEPNAKNTDGHIFTSIEFTPDGKEILIAQYDGGIKVMDAQTGQYIKLNTPLKTSERKGYPITQLIVSSDGKYFAVCDTNRCVSLFKKDHLQGDPAKQIEWQFTGKILSHEIDVSSIAFGQGLDEQGMPMHRLFSIGKDRRMFEYDVYNSKPDQRLFVLRYFKIEQEALPSSCIWYPKKDSKEGLLLTANNEYKMKIWNPSAQSSRKTCLGPTYGGEITKMKELAVPNQEEKYLVYATAKKVIGLIKMPLDGNPNKTMGLIAHPDEIADFCTSSDGRYLFTCGGSDLSVKMWSIDVSPIEHAIHLGGQDIEPFINLIEGGSEGQIFQDMKDFFYYSMIRSKDENTTKTRKLDGTVPLAELPNLMRAMGYYPTEQEVQNMKDEVKFSVYSDMGDPTTSVDMNTFIRLFVNHRPVYGIGKNNIEDAFKALAGDGSSIQLTRDDMISLLKQEGEVFGDEELQQSLGYLVGKMLYKDALPKDYINSEEFATDLLGFEEFEEGEEEGDLAEPNVNGGYGGETMANKQFGGMGNINEVIPEEEGF
uniref:Cilia- and flagella-associated protein 251 n=1 Tax=Strombidium rassoulzadegani TaxID=1082188 RepID=A0A7S3CT12_9SPIT|mmetsp:Transcript_7892/g.13231  ORF Transcript_7892/g.13231 Transcript_7892/m.13231 type:complete len:770 (+) Transcript_7892:780-3089(+)